MTNIRTISDLSNRTNEICDFCNRAMEPVFIKREDIDTVVMSVEMYERREAQIDLYAKLAEAETDAANGDKGIDFNAFAQKLRTMVHGAV